MVFSKKILTFFVYYVHEGYESVCRLFTLNLYLGQGCPDRGSGAKFGSLAKFIWLLCVLFCVMHFGSGGLKEYNASTLEG